MIDIKKAMDLCISQLKSFYPDIQGIQVEEVELSEDSKYFFITLSYYDNEIVSLSLYPKPKKFKIFKIDTEKGNIISMKIRVFN